MRNLDKKRLFIALNLTVDIKKIISDSIIELREKNPDIKWIDPEGAHLTLVFLGSIDGHKESVIIEAMEKLENKFGELRFKLDRLSAFPSRNNPRVIFLSCLELEKKMAQALQKTIKTEIEIRTDLKFDNRPWKAHITLGRVKGMGAAIDFNKNIDPKEFEVKTFDLMRSELKPDGAKYTLVKSYKL